MNEAAKALRTVRAVMLAGTAILGTQMPAAAEAISPASDAQFAALVQACWTRDTAAGFSTMCFDRDGRSYFLAYSSLGRDGLIAIGRVRIEGGEVHLEGAGDAWPFERGSVTCDGIVEPRRELRLVQCSGHGEEVGRVLGEPPNQDVADSRWEYSGSLADCDWCRDWAGAD